MTARAVSISCDLGGSPCFDSSIRSKGCGLTNIPNGLIRSQKDQVKFDSIHNLKKFLNNFCYVPGKDQAGACSRA